MNLGERAADSAFLAYRPLAGVRDEMVDADGAVRPAWRYLHEALAALGPGELEARAGKARRILGDDGATYNVYGVAARDNRWRIDPIPWVIDSEEWRAVEAGLEERAALLDLLLGDLYGAREVVARRLLPPEVVFGHRGFLRPCQDLPPLGAHRLVLYACDLIRRSDGQFVVLGDRTQAPSGAGYALENRTVMSRVFPSLFRDSHVHRLAGFFAALRSALVGLARGVDAPCIALLTPGPHNETYFEHALLATYLGFPLVQSGDLVVREGRLWMKSLEGLTRVDVLLRRVDDDFCDPVELRGDSRLGVAGLLELVRTGRVAVVNLLGSGVLESPALAPFLPGIARHFLGRELRLPGVATWWCGDPAARAQVLERLDELVVKPVVRRPGRHSLVVAELSAAERDRLVRALLRRPDQFVAQERLVPSTLPVWAGGRLEPRSAVLRTFAVAGDGSWRVMAGGLTRVGAPGASLVSNQAGAISKDTWVVASEPEKRITLLAGFARGLERAPLPSRVVENLYWFGRYAERAENALRLLRTLFLAFNAAEPVGPRPRALLLEAVARLTDTPPERLPVDLDGGDLLSALAAVVADRSRPGTVAFDITAMLNCAEETRELLSADTQRIIGELRELAATLEADLGANLTSAPEEVLDPLVTAFLALAGLVHESMVHGTGWRFLDMGRRLERAKQTLVLMRTLLVPVDDELTEATLQEALLQTLESLITYRRRYRAGLALRDVLELTLVDAANPRSVRHQLERLAEHVAALPGSGGRREPQPEERAALEALSLVRLADLQALCAAEEGRRAALEVLFDTTWRRLAETSDRIAAKFFTHQEGPRQLVSQRWELD
ncbi:MAG: hypothetical protein KatS3mg124_0453 [Porticoccaceae bacterium]|nr:MAG: hypothetical protein KatS3mg124_0453 [Porticoccaceae bacterium]